MSYEDGICEVRYCRREHEIIDHTTGTQICLCGKHNNELDDEGILFVNKKLGVLMMRDGKPYLLKLPKKLEVKK